MDRDIAQRSIFEAGQFRDPRTHSADKEEQYREAYAGNDAPLQVRGQIERQHEGDNRDHTILGLRLPSVNHRLNFNQVDHRQNYD